MKKFQNKYRIPSAQLQNWDYGENGAYFITICTKNMVHYFGDVETRLIASVQSQNENENEKGGFAGDKNPMLNENISRIIRWYKGRCSFEMRKIHADFEWLSRFHDHIIRDSNEFERIQTYIENNPSKWFEDKFNKR